VRSGTIFDNFLITDDEEYAERFGKATWGETKVHSMHGLSSWPVLAFVHFLLKATT
jgi:hypothetical protein